MTSHLTALHASIHDLGSGLRAARAASVCNVNSNNNVSLPQADD